MVKIAMNLHSPTFEARRWPNPPDNLVPSPHHGQHETWIAGCDSRVSNTKPTQTFYLLREIQTARPQKLVTKLPWKSFIIKSLMKVKPFQNMPHSCCFPKQLSIKSFKRVNIQNCPMAIACMHVKINAHDVLNGVIMNMV